MAAFLAEMLVNVLADFVGTGALAMLAFAAWQIRQRQYRDWSAVLVNGDQIIDRQPLGIGTAKEWLADPWRRKLGLKSMCSDNGFRLNVDVSKISHVDKNGRNFVVRGEENPAPKPAHASATKPATADDFASFRGDIVNALTSNALSRKARRRLRRRIFAAGNGHTG